MKKYFPSSAFRLLCIFLVNALFQDLWLLVLGIIYLWLFSGKDTLYFAVMIVLFFGRCHFELPLFHEGVIIAKRMNVYTVRNDFYDVEVLIAQDIPLGKHICFEVASSRNYQSEKNDRKLSRNILYQVKSDEFLITEQFNESYFKKYISYHSPQAKAFLLRFLCGEISPDLAEELLLIGFSLTYLFRYLFNMRHGSWWSASYLLLHYWLFGARLQLFFLTFLWLGEQLCMERSESLLISVFVLVISQPYYLYGKSFVIHLSFYLFYCLETSLSSTLFVCFMEMFLNNGLHLLRIFLWKFFRKIGVFLYFLAFLSLFFTEMDFVLIFLGDWLTKLFSCYDYFLPGKLTPIYCLLYFSVLRSFSIKGKVIPVSILILFLLVRIQAPNCGFHFIDVGHGDATYFEDRGRNFNMLIDTGDAFHYKEVKAYLYSLGVREIDVLMLSHGDADHAANKEAVIKDFHVRKVIEKKGENFEWNGSKWFFLDTGEADNENDRSLVYYGSIDNRAILFTGDISRSIEKRIIRNYSPFRLFFLKGPHHGSATSSSAAFLDTLQPNFVSLSTNGKYHHPAPEVIKRYQERGIRYFVTKESGTIRYLFFRFFDLLYTADGTVMFLGKEMWR